MRQSSALSVSVLTALALAGGAAAWDVRYAGNADEDGNAVAVRVDANGDVAAAGALRFGAENQAGAVKLAGADGAEIWRSALTANGGTASALDIAADGRVGVGGVSWVLGSGVNVAGILQSADGSAFLAHATRSSNDQVRAAQFDAAGHLAVSGTAKGPEATTANGPYTVWKVAAFGGLLWSRSIIPFVLQGVQTDGTADGLTVAANGDVISVGRAHSLVLSPFGYVGYGDYRGVVARLASADGAVLWTHVTTEEAHFSSAALDATGDVLVAGAMYPAGSNLGDLVVLKLSGADGSELWRRTVDLAGGADMAYDVAVDAAGDVVVAGELATIAGFPPWGGGSSEMAVLKLAGADGAEIWRHRVANTLPDPVVGVGRAITLDANGNPLVAGVMDAEEFFPVGGVFMFVRPGLFTVLELDGATGDRESLQTLDRGDAYAIDLDRTPSGDGAIVVSGTTVRDTGDGTEDDFTVVKFTDRLDGQTVDLRDDPVPERRRMKVQSRDALILAPSRYGPGDPVLHGARLVLGEPGGTSHTYELPAANWEAKARGFLYRDSRRTAGPCSYVAIRSGKQVKAKCQGAGMGSMAPGRTPNALDVRLELGSQAARYCMRFGGDIDTRRPGRFRASDAPAPPDCGP